MESDHTTRERSARQARSGDSGVPALLLGIAVVLLAAVGAIVLVSQSSGMWAAGVGMGAIVAATAVVMVLIGRQLGDDGDPAPAPVRRLRGR
jgi:hypothetical protein